ncbi:response regulator transcription factor [Streptococcus cameli]
MPHILVVEDDPIINQVVCEFLRENNYQVTTTDDGQKAMELYANTSFDVIILDIMIPSLSGLEVLKAIRQESDIPIVMLTAMDDEYTQLISFQHLISDYVTKPFSPLILMKRIENILRLQKPTDTITLSRLVISPEHGTVFWDQKEVKLTKKEYAILLLLSREKGHILTRDAIMMDIWGYTELDSRVLDNHMKNLRKKIPDLPLKTIIGRGYKMEEEE